MRETQRHPLTRRAFLRGTGAAMALPFIEQLAPGAAPGPYEANPRLVFDRMFRGRPPVVPNWKTRAATNATPSGTKKDTIDRSVLDLVREEATDLRRDLGAADRARLDQYLDGVRSIE